MTKIPLTQETWNPVTGCTKIAAGCKNCYAEAMARRFWGKRKFTEVRCHEDRLNIPIHWRQPKKIFICSMGDLFHPKVPFEFIDKVHAAIIMAYRNRCYHTYQVLTKRPKRMLKYYSTNRRSQLFKILEKDYDEITGFYGIRSWPFPNLWLGTSISTQADADKNIPILLQIPAAVRFLSIEPLLEEIYLPGPLLNHGYGLERSQEDSVIQQVIIGCESGPNRRPCKLEWVRDIIRHCDIAVPRIHPFVKQIKINGKVSHNLIEWPKWAQRQDLEKNK